MQTVTTSEAAETAAEPKLPRRGVGTVAVEAIRAGKTNAEALAAVKAEFPDAKASLASINWYRNDLRSKGENIPTARALTAAAKPPVEKKARAKKADAAAPVSEESEGSQDFLN